jgi:hypothetical protein
VLESVDVGWGLPSPVSGLELGRWDIANRLQEPTVVEPVDPLQGGVPEVVDAPVGCQKSMVPVTSGSG